MKAESFPINYFRGMTSPRRIFAGRKQFNWYQLVFIYIFLTALLLIPVTLNLANLTISIDEYLPNINSLFTEEVAGNFQQLTVENGVLQNDEKIILGTTAEGIVGANLSEADMSGNTYSINFRRDQWGIIDQVDGEPYTFNLNYSNQFDPQEVTSSVQLEAMMSNEFYLNNRAAIILTRLLATGFILFAMNLVLVLGTSFFLWLTKKSNLSSVNSFKESVSITIQALGLGTILAFLTGLLYYDIIVMMGIQTLTLVALLFGIYIKTRFKDQKGSEA